MSSSALWPGGKQVSRLPEDAGHLQCSGAHCYSGQLAERLGNGNSSQKEQEGTYP